ncbi:MAG: replication restart helicase PriA [Microbacter sp.]
MNPSFVEIILPVPIEGTFTYFVPDALSPVIQVGMRVVVPFGKSKLYCGIVHSLHFIEPSLNEVKSIVALMDDYPMMIRPQFQLWEWIASYYMTTLGEIFVAAIPMGLRLESETQVCIHPDFDDESVLTIKEMRLFKALSADKTSTIAELIKRTQSKQVMVEIKRMMEKNAVVIAQTLSVGYKPKTVTMVKAAFNKEDEATFKSMLDGLKRAKKQMDLLLTYFDLSRFLSQNEPMPVSKKMLLEQTGASPAVLNALVDKGILQLYDQKVSRLVREVLPEASPKPLNASQSRALKDILNQWKTKNVVLLHGVTSSGKTEIYIHLIQKMLDLGRQVLYLVPEIALTTQLTSRLERIFGNQLGVYHSKYSDNERVEVWNNLLKREGIQVVLGVRSSVFLPFHDLGLIIVDEEHEVSYKQQDVSPRYHARDTAIVLAQFYGAKVLLGSATPSVETYQNALSDKFGLVELQERFSEIPLPQIFPVDLREAYRKKRIVGHFSDELIEAMTKALSADEQIILFHNRRGFAPFIECKQCGYVAKCQHCDVSLTYHKSNHRLICHYCGYSEPLPDRCPACGSNAVTVNGLGTEKVEEELGTLFPNSRIGRLDLDAVTTRRGFERIITAFEQHEIDILIGTQMVAKGLDFSNVSLVGLLNADTLLHFPNFRANERAFQLITQVSGRAGRYDKQGKVILQTMNPDHPIIRQVIAQNYPGMFQMQMKERHAFHYPPYYRLIQITLRHKNELVVQRAAQQMAAQLTSLFADRVLGPEIPPIGRLMNWHLRTVLLKFEVGSSHKALKELLRKSAVLLRSEKSFSSVQIIFDVDPI